MDDRSYYVVCSKLVEYAPRMRVEAAVRAVERTNGVDTMSLFELTNLAKAVLEKQTERRANRPIRERCVEVEIDFEGTKHRHYFEKTIIARDYYGKSGVGSEFCLRAYGSSRIYLKYGGPDFLERGREIKTEINSQSDDIVNVLHAVLEELQDRMNVIETCDCEWCERYARYDSAITRLIVGISRVRTARDKAMETKVDIAGMEVSKYSFDQGVYCALDTCLQMIEGLL